MDFIPFNSTPKQSNQSLSQQNRNGGNKQSVNLNKMPAFGSPAIVTSPVGNVPFGSPAFTNQINHGGHTSPRCQNQQYTPRGYNNFNSSPRGKYHAMSPRHPNQSYNHSPRNCNTSPSPRQQNQHNFLPSPYSGRNRYSNTNDGSEFKTPHQFSPSMGRGRKSIAGQFGQTPRIDPNYNHGGSLNIEDYYHPSMMQDPWRNLNPVIVQT